MTRILVVKPKPGRYRSLFAKLANINSKNGPFDLIICVSDLFCAPQTAEDEAELGELLDQKISVPVRMLCMGGSIKLPDRVREAAERNDGQVSPNLELLAPESITTLAASGKLCVATFGGIYDPAQYNSTEGDPESNPSNQNYIRSEATSKFVNKLKAVVTPSQPIDILITHSMPQLLTLHSKMPPKDPAAAAWGCPPVTNVLQTSQPRYHFSGGSQPEFWEREPWVWDPDTKLASQHPVITRFINLGEFGNASKERWFYAFNILPISEAKPTRPPNATPCPYSFSVRQNPKRPAANWIDEDSESGPNFRFSETTFNQKKARTGGLPPNYICKICQTPGHWIQDCPEKSIDSTKPQDGYVCRKCNIPGHLIQNCPNAGHHESGMKSSKTYQPKEIGPVGNVLVLSV